MYVYIYIYICEYIIYMCIFNVPKSLDDTSSNKGKHSRSLFDGVPASLFACASHSRPCLLCDTADTVCSVAQQTMSAV